MIEETDKRIIDLIIKSINRTIDLVQNHEQEIITNYIYSDSLQYEFEKIFEDYKRLSAKFIINHPYLPIKELRGIRNRVAHDYESIIIEILIDTVKKDFPSFLEMLIKIENT